MDHVWEANASATPPTFPAGLQTGYPVESPAPTVIGNWWYHQITEEIRNAIIAAGLTPDGSTVTQLATAITSLASKTLPNGSGTGLGAWVGLNSGVQSGTSASAVLPAGGSWAYYMLAAYDDGNVTRVVSYAGIAAGGTTVYSAGAQDTAQGFAWRIA